MKILRRLVDGRCVIDIRLPFDFFPVKSTILLETFKPFAVDEAKTFLKAAGDPTIHQARVLKELYADRNQIGLHYFFDSIEETANV